MTPVRAGVALSMIGLIGLCVVILRSEGVRLDVRTQAHRSELTRLHRRAWTLQMEVARLRSPQQISERVARMELQVRAPIDADMWWSGSGGRLAVGHR